MNRAIVMPSMLPAPPPLHTGFDAVVHGLVGRMQRRRVHTRRLQAESVRAGAAMGGLRDLDDAALRSCLTVYRDAMRRDPREGRGELCQALGAIGEAAGRSLSLRPYEVQLMGALALHRGYLAEMATGEGKTLTTALAAVLAGWSGRPCHVVTANDYLAARDAADMKPLFAACGLAVSAVTGDMSEDERIRQYRADVVYITPKELLGDFLRDRLAARGADPRQVMLLNMLAGEGDGQTRQRQVRGLHTAIIDEADSVLIDEAVTPLILSAPCEGRSLADAARLMAELAGQLREGADYAVALKQKTVLLKDGARRRLDGDASRLPALWRAAPRREELLRQALYARHFLHRNKHYVIEDDKVVLLDDFTGRMTPNRTLSAGLHQAIEAREGLTVTNPTESLGQMSFQNFFRRFRRLAGMTGTGADAADEFWRIYGLGVVCIPTNRPCQRRITTPVFFPDDESKWQAVLADIESMHRLGRPVLIGTCSVRSSEQLAARLAARGLAFALLNAVRHRDEARIVAEAGRPGQITIATNMAGRGTDIRVADEALAQGGLHVIVTEMHEAARIDRQLMGRCARQGDPGSVAIFLCAEDELVMRFLRGAGQRVLRAAVADGAGAWLSRRLFRLAQRRAERQAAMQRYGVLVADRWLESALPFGDNA